MKTCKTAYAMVCSVLGVAIAPINASGADFCREIIKVVNLAPSGFEAIKLDQRRSSYNTSIVLPYASSCWISKKNSYWCTWKVDARSQLRQAVANFLASLSKCYPGSETENYFQDDEPYGYIYTRSAEIYVAASNDDVEVEMSIQAK